MPKRFLIAFPIACIVVVVAAGMILLRRPPAPKISTPEVAPESAQFVNSPISGKRHAMSDFKPMPGSTTTVLCPDTGKPIPRAQLLAQLSPATKPQ